MTSKSCSASYFRLLLLLIFNWSLVSCYLIIIDVSDRPGKIIFNSAVNNLGLERQYNLSSYKNAHFIKKIFNVNQNSGEISLKTYVKCEGIQYPTVFSFYVDSTTSLYHINYYSLHLRVYIIGENCKKHGNLLIQRKYNFDLSMIGKYLPSNLQAKKDCYANNRMKSTTYLSDSKTHFSNKTMTVLQTISRITKLEAETYASYAIHSPRNQICFKKSQVICNLSHFLPQSVRERCLTDFISVTDFRVSIETLNQDIVASSNVCVSELMWKVEIILRLHCSELYDFKLIHRLTIIFYQHQLSISDLVKRVRRDLKNQSLFFEQSLYVTAVSEEEKEGKVVTTVQARDPENSFILYSMTSLIDSRSQSMFKIDLHTGVITTTKPLDRELMDVHYFQIVATDDSFPPRSGTTTLQVNVLDCNDNFPIFETDCYDTTIREGSPVGTSVISVRANDRDTGKNAKIEYTIRSIVGGEKLKNGENLEAFRIDSDTGVISVQDILDREETEVYTVIIAATDSPDLHNEQKSATGTVIVTILDENDNYPEFILKFYNIQIKENVWDNKAIAHIKAHDKDKGNNAAIRYSIIGGNAQTQFSIDSMTGEIFLAKPLDYEAVQNFRLIIRAQDGGNPSRSNTTQVLVQVIDVNDNSPRFFVTNFRESVLENVPIGFHILRVQAYDPDQGLNADIRYNIVEPEESLPFAVDEKTGWIQTTKQLDREACSNFAFNMIAADRGEPSRSASAHVAIIIQDVNDNDPFFQSKYYEVVISEDLPPGSSIVTVTAMDPDENSRLHYDITSGNARGRFGITVQNGKGVVTLTQPLDYKQESRFLLTISASDAGGRSDTAYLNINITDANNYAPSFDNSPYSATIMEDAPIGTTVLIVTATDNDVGINAQITYSLQEPINGIEQTVPFVINSKTGAITTIFSLDREDKSAYFLSVEATDGGQPSFSDTTDIEIVVTDVNDNPPKFTTLLYQASIPEDAVVGTSIIQVYAEDDDIGINGQIVYSFSNNQTLDGSFIIDSISGIVRTFKLLDRESVETYSIFISAIDKGEPSLSSSVEVKIKLEDVNDSPPSFSVDKITMYIQENSPIGTIVGKIEAHDPDEGVNAVVQYSIIGGKDAMFFSLLLTLESKGAQLISTTKLDYESPKKYFEIIVRAASPPLKTDVQVDILVTDVNDNAPILKDFQVFFNNYPGKFPTEEIGRVPAFDADITDELSFKIISGNAANFVKLNETTGGITLYPELNTNVPMHIFMEISVTDGMNEAKATMQLIVRLISDKSLFNSITVKLNEITEESFLSPLLEVFVEALSVVIPCPKENIFLFSIKKDDDMLNAIDASFSALRSDINSEEFFTPEFLQERVYLNRAIITNLVGIEVIPFDDALCLQEPCLNFEECHTFLKFEEAAPFIFSDTVLFRSILPVNTFACRCPEGFTGSKEHYLCDTEIDLCYSNPCLNHGQCLRREGGFTCMCKDGFVGQTCELNFKPCGNHSCETDFACSIIDVNSSLSNYSQACGLKSRYFPHYSFVTFNSLRFRHRFNIKLSFATLEPDGLLFYNGRHSESNDYIALEIVDGRIWFSFSLGNSKHIVNFQRGKIISDGLWHTAEVIYFNRTATVVIDSCDKALRNLTRSWNCVNQTTLVLEKKCSTPTVPCHRFLDLTGPFQVGGLSTFSKNTQVRTRYFDGCISNIVIDDRFLDLNAFASENGTIVGCPQKALFCKFEPCYNGGTCIEGWNQHLCHCPQEYTGSACQKITYLPWRFLKNSILSFNPVLRPIQLPWNLGFSLRTLKQNTFIMKIHIGQNSSVITTLNNGVLVISFDAKVFFFQKFLLADGKWHRIELNWTGSTIEVSIDYYQRSDIRSILTNIQDHYFRNIVFGNFPDRLNDDRDINFYEGCIQDLQIGGIQNVLNLPTLRKNVEDGCTSKEKCPKLCPKKSNCVESWDQAHCECLPGYIGHNCDPVCAFHPCNAGVCHADPRRLKFYHCECNNTSYFGENCEYLTELPCPSGWWGKPVCGPCKCDTSKGYNANCNKETGECRCEDNHYQPVGETSCFPCNCYSIGSFQTNCNVVSGQCVCRDGVIGRRCDSCASPFAEVTYSGCEVVYDACPRSYSEGIWWDRTPLGRLALQNCPKTAEGKASRICDGTSGTWQKIDLFNCTSKPLMNLKKELLKIRKHELQLNSFLSIKLVREMRNAIQLLTGVVSANTFDKIFNVADFAYNSALTKLPNNTTLFCNDILIIDGLLHKIIDFQKTLRGLNMSHRQDKDFLRNLIFSASFILSKKYAPEWSLINATVHRGPQDLVEIIRNYMAVLAESHYETFGIPFEIVHDNMVLGLDIVSFGTLNNTSNQTDNRKSKRKGSISKASNMQSFHNLRSTKFLSKISIVSLPKYDNYMQDKMKFDKLTKIWLPIGILKENIGFDNSYSISDYQAIITYAQYKDAGGLFPEKYDGTVSKRWGTNLCISSALISLVVLVPNSQNKANSNLEKSRFFRDNALFIEKLTKYESQRSTQNATDSNNCSAVNDSIKNHNKQLLKDVIQNKSYIKQTNVSKHDSIISNVFFNEYESLESHTLKNSIQLQIFMNINASLLRPKLNPQCVRWNKMTGCWTRLGCQTEIPNFENNRLSRKFFVNCTCNIISTYAVLVDLSANDDIFEPYIEIKWTVYTAFLSSLSILAVIIILHVITRGPNTNSNSIHQNIVICIFFAELLLFIGIQTQISLRYTDFICKLIAISLHYLWLAGFAWVTINCFHLYRMLTEMRSIDHGSMCFYTYLGFGAPAILVALSVGVRAQEYGNNLFCGLSLYESIIWWLVVPVCSMTGISLYLLFMCIKNAFTLKQHTLGFQYIRKLLLLSVTLLPLMAILLLLTLLSTSKKSQFLLALLSVMVFVHAIYCLLGDCFLNQHVQDSFCRTYFRCFGKTVPVVDTPTNVDIHNRCNEAVNSQACKIGSIFNTSKRSIGINSSSTTSRSTGKTSSSPYRSGKDISISTSHYNSVNEISNSTMVCNHKENNTATCHVRNAASDVALASSHSSDEEELKGDKIPAFNHEQTHFPHYFSIGCSTLGAKTSFDPSIGQRFGHFSVIEKSAYISQWSSGVCNYYLSAHKDNESHTTPEYGNFSCEVKKKLNLLTNPDLSYSECCANNNEKGECKCRSDNNPQREACVLIRKRNDDHEKLTESFDTLRNTKDYKKSLDTNKEEFESQNKIFNFIDTLEEKKDIKKSLNNFKEESEHQNKSFHFITASLPDKSIEDGYNFPFTAEEDHVVQMQEDSSKLQVARSDVSHMPELYSNQIAHLHETTIKMTTVEKKCFGVKEDETAV